MRLLINRSEINSLNINFLAISVFLVFICGCTTVRQLPFDQGLTKQELQKWKKPDRTCFNPGKYSADEMWIYEYPDSNQVRYYFKNGKVINAEEIIYDNL